MRIARRAACAAAIVAALAAIGCGGSDSADETSTTTAAENSAGVSAAEFEALQVGDSEADVREQLGKPTSEQQTTVEDLGKGTCAFYGKLGEPTYEFCFVDGELATKGEF